MAKISKLFRLSEEAVAILNTKPNASRFVEDLILKGGEGISRGESMILEKLENLVAEPLPMAYNKEEGTVNGIPIEKVLETKLTPSDIMADINNLTAARDDELEWCQDAREIKRIKDEYQVKIDEAWRAFHATKTQTSPPTA